MDVGIVGSGPASEAVRAALADANARVKSVESGDVGDVGLAVVVDRAGAATFERANDAALRRDGPWLAVELGGIGGIDGHDVGIEAAIAGFAPGTGCYACLRARVAANAADATDVDAATSVEKSAPPTIDPPTAGLAGAIAGREAARLLAGGESSVLGGVVELPHAERAFLPVPHCECAGERDRTLAYGDGPHERGRGADERDESRRDGGADDLGGAVARAERALDPRVGIVSEVGEAASFPAPYYLARSASTDGFSDASAASEAAGVSAGWDEALMKALGEALERYSAGVYRERGFTTAPASDLEGAVAPAAFVLPEGVDPNPEEPLSWVAGEDLRTGGRAHLPAEFVQFPPPAHEYGPSITTGLGLGSSEAAALLSGLYEAIERDAAMLAWYSTFEPLGLAVSDAEYRELARRARGEGLSVTPLLVTQDVDVPVVAVAVHREAGGDDGAIEGGRAAEGGGVDGRDGDESGSDGWPRFAVGSSANLDAAAAARSALAEALQSWMELRAMGPDGATDAEGAIGRYADFPASTRAFVEPAGRVPAASVGEEVPGAAAELDALLGRVADAGLDAYAARLTTRDVERLGFEAVRVLVPGAQPLFTGAAFFGERARTVPEELGFEPRLDREHHPYP